MPRSDPSSSTATTPQASAQDTQTQTLITLLGSLMPILLRIQSQFEPATQISSTNTALQNPILDYQAAVSLAENITADSLRTLSTYLESHTPKHAGLEHAVLLVTHAAHCFAARDFAQAFGLIWQAYRVITALQATNPQLPPLRAAAAEASLSTPTTLFH